MASRDEADDRRLITAVLYRYATALDSQRWELLDEVFTADAHLDFSSAGSIEGLYPEVRAWLETHMSRFRRLQHFVTNVRVELAADRARAQSYVHAVHGWKDDRGFHLAELGGEYRDRFVATDAGWRIQKRVLVHHWSRGDRPPDV
ncbi:MAG: nuclear transport factor 2 family protein [Myxococcales bacterium]|nr:nuclear transport factor 2 family protein [Myxococcales bacterium]